MKLGKKLKNTLRVIGEVLLALFNRDKEQPEPNFPDTSDNKGYDKRTSETLKYQFDQEKKRRKEENN